MSLKRAIKALFVLIMVGLTAGCFSNTRNCAAENVQWSLGSTHPSGVYATEIRVGKTGNGRVLHGNIPAVHATKAHPNQMSFFTDLPPKISADWFLLPEKTPRSAEFDTSKILPDCAEPKTEYNIMITFGSENELDVQVKTSPIRY